jgi:hypothetical protein
MENIMENVDLFLKENKILYNRIDITELLLTSVYLNNYNKSSKKYTLKNKIKDLITKILIKVPYESITIKKNNFIFKDQYKYVFSFGFSIKDYRHIKVLKELINNLSKQEVLILTDQKDVFDYYSKSDYSIIFISPKKFASKNLKTKNNINVPKFNWILGKSLLKIDYLNFLYSKINAEILISSQDFHIFDQINTKLAKKHGFKTITHQHGIINEPHPGLFKYVFSDKILLWGNNSKKRLEKFVESDKLLTTGTTKFNYLFSEIDYTREFITLAINPLPKDLNPKIVNAFLDLCKNIKYNFKNKYKFILKLHPSLNKVYWEKHINYYKKSINILVKKNDNKKILNKSKILISYKSTISLEAMICKCSVIELNVGTQNTSKLLFENLEDSIINFKNLDIEVFKRLNDSNYNLDIIKRQNDVVQNEIKTFNLDYELDVLSKI